MRSLCRSLNVHQSTRRVMCRHVSKSSWGVTPLFQKLIDQTGLVHDTDLSNLVARTLTGGVYGMGMITLLGTIGIDTQPLLAGIGVTGE
jgi:small-conductance mechanosensitive channel